jgi:DNA-binding phage protein
MISAQLRRAVYASGKTKYAIAKGAGIATMQLYRFMDRDRTITLDTADALCQYLGLELAEKAAKTKRKTQP